MRQRPRAGRRTAARAASERPRQPASATAVRPARVCAALLAALDASDGRRRRRKRDTTPDAVGLSLKRRLLTLALQTDPDPDTFEAWLLEHCLAAAGAEASAGALRAMAKEIMAEWRLAAASPEFRAWLSAGAPSDDRR
jgi:hypothetical protein